MMHSPLAVLLNRLDELDRQTKQCSDGWTHLQALSDRVVHADRLRMAEIGQREGELRERFRLLRVIQDAWELRDICGMENEISKHAIGSLERQTLDRLMQSIIHTRLLRAQLVDHSYSISSSGSGSSGSSYNNNGNASGVNSANHLYIHWVPHLVPYLLAHAVPFQRCLQQTVDRALDLIEWVPPAIDMIEAEKEWPALEPHQVLRVAWSSTPRQSIASLTAVESMAIISDIFTDLARFIQLFPRQCAALSAVASQSVMEWLERQSTKLLWSDGEIDSVNGVRLNMAGRLEEELQRLINVFIDRQLEVEPLREYLRQLPRLTDKVCFNRQLYRLRAKLLGTPLSTKYYTDSATLATPTAHETSSVSLLGVNWWPMDWQVFPSCRLSSQLLDGLMPELDSLLVQPTIDNNYNHDNISAMVDKVEMAVNLFTDVVSNYYAMHHLTVALPQNYFILHNDFHFIHYRLNVAAVNLSRSIAIDATDDERNTETVRLQSLRLHRLACRMGRRADDILHETLCHHQQELRKQMEATRLLYRCRDETADGSLRSILTAELKPLLADLTKLRRLLYPILPPPVFLYFLTKLVESVIAWCADQILQWGDMDAEMCEYLYGVLCDCHSHTSPQLQLIKHRLISFDELPPSSISASASNLSSSSSSSSSPSVTIDSRNSCGGFLYELLDLLTIGSSSSINNGGAAASTDKTTTHNFSMISETTQFNLMLMEMLDLTLNDIRVLLQRNFEGCFLRETNGFSSSASSASTSISTSSPSGKGLEPNNADQGGEENGVVDAKGVGARKIRRLIEAIFAESKQRRDFLGALQG